MITDALLLCGGLGSRMNPLTKYMPKCLIPIYDRPLIIHQINILESVNVNNFFLVINKYFEVLIKHYLEFGYTGNARFTFLIQKVSNGCGEAALCGSDYLDKRFFLVLGDEYYEGNLFFKKAATDLKFEHILGLTKYDSMKQIVSGCHVITENNKVVRLLEKPKPRDICSGICWNGAAVTNREIFKELVLLKQEGKVDPRRGLLLTDAFNNLIRKGHEIGAVYDPGININITEIPDYLWAAEIERRKRLEAKAW